MDNNTAPPCIETVRKELSESDNCKRIEQMLEYYLVAPLTKWEKEYLFQAAFQNDRADRVLTCLFKSIKQHVESIEPVTISGKAMGLILGRGYKNTFTTINNGDRYSISQSMQHKKVTGNGAALLQALQNGNLEEDGIDFIQSLINNGEVHPVHAIKQTRSNRRNQVIGNLILFFELAQEQMDALLPIIIAADNVLQKLHHDKHRNVLRLALENGASPDQKHGAIMEALVHKDEKEPVQNYITHLHRYGMDYDCDDLKQAINQNAPNTLNRILIVTNDGLADQSVFECARNASNDIQNILNRHLDLPASITTAYNL